MVFAGPHGRLLGGVLLMLGPLVGLGWRAGRTTVAVLVGVFALAEVGFAVVLVRGGSSAGAVVVALLVGVVARGLAGVAAPPVR